MEEMTADKCKLFEQVRKEGLSERSNVAVEVCTVYEFLMCALEGLTGSFGVH